MSELLAHLKVVDLTDALGAVAGRMLAELGAEVLRPSGGDLAWNHGKQQIDPSDIDTALPAPSPVPSRGSGRCCRLLA